jgi:uncharacterized damage-inducible protein DinB
MQIDISSIQNPRVRFFYSVYWPQRQVLRDFFALLPEEQFDYRMVDTANRKSDTPTESLAHILQVQLVFLNGAKTGKLEYKPMGVEHYWQMTKEQLLSEMERVDSEMFAYLTAESFDSDRGIVVPWGEMNVIDLLLFLRDHDILHIGWNLALMDHLDLPRYESLSMNWGSGDEDSI